jgi:hypothetical protein
LRFFSPIGWIGISQMMSTPMAFRRGRSAVNAFSVPSLLYWRRLTSYTWLRDHAGAGFGVADGGGPYRVASGSEAASFFITLLLLFQGAFEQLVDAAVFIVPASGCTKPWRSSGYEASSQLSFFR